MLKLSVRLHSCSKEVFSGFDHHEGGVGCGETGFGVCPVVGMSVFGGVGCVGPVVSAQFEIHSVGRFVSDTASAMVSLQHNR